MTAPEKGRLWAMLVALAALSMLGPFSIDTPFPAFGRMEREFGVGSDEMQLLVTSYMLAFAVMSPFHGPISDAVGRRPVMLAGLGVYVLASIGCALAPNLPVLLFFRVLQGLSAGGGIIVSRAVIRDVFDGPEAQRLMARVMMIFGVAPAVAPVIGGWLLVIGSWRTIFWFLVVVAVAMAALVIWMLPESHPPQRRIEFRPGALMAGLVDAAKSAAFHKVAWAGSFAFAGYFIYVGAAAIVVDDLLGKGERDFWMLMVPLIAGMVVGSGISSRTSGKVSLNRLITFGICWALFGAAINALVASVTSALPWVVVGPGLIGVGTGACYAALQLTLLDMFPATRGATVSLFTFFTLMLNGLVAGFVTPHVTGSLLALAAASLVFEVLAVLLWGLHLLGRRAVAPPTVLTPGQR